MREQGIKDALGTPIAGIKILFTVVHAVSPDLASYGTIYIDLFWIAAIGRPARC